jgi:hypothetical protein
MAAAQQPRTRRNKMYRDCDTDQVIEQLGKMNIMAVSGGRVYTRKTGVTLPVGRGYSVEIDLQGNDTYVVKRVFTRAGKVTIKGEVVDVYAFDLGDVAYYASCYVNVPFGQDILGNREELPLTADELAEI